MVAMARARVIRMIRLGTKESSGQQKRSTLYNALTKQPYHYTFVQTHMSNWSNELKC